MSILSRILGSLAKLRKAETHDIAVERSLRIPMPDGVILLADRYAPELAGGDRLPILLCRSPYGRGFGGLLARVLAERGYQVVLVSCRGTFGSGGTWEPFFNERADGLEVFRWLEVQPWFSGSVGLFGASYLGLTEWAVADFLPPWVRALSLAVTQSHFGDFVRPGGTFALESALAWITGLHYQEQPLLAKALALRRAQKRMAHATQVLPLADSGAAMVDRQLSYFRDWAAHPDPRDPYWSRIDFGGSAGQLPPSVFVAGWYDIFCAGQVQDFINARAAGQTGRLVIGPWTHASLGGGGCVLAETLGWMDYCLLGGEKVAPPPVRLFVMGSGRWVDFPQWPPAGSPTTWHLIEKGGLSGESATASDPSRYVYDPADPTPVAGGRSLYEPGAGPKDNRTTESRADVLVYSSPVLENDLTVIGSIRVDLCVRSSLDHVDFFARVCDVAPGGRSTNLCDGIIRMEPSTIRRAADGSYRVGITLSPTANTFRKGHRVRVQVSSGAHPLYARNPGSDDAQGLRTDLRSSNQEVLHGPDHPSTIELPVVGVP